ncbi:tRNA preQ1(34) S-adenosylmethionine ribosyltransferase-isomerase QueA [Candidatus Uhrbacteria bacterium]|nr:tRNA preQ1(34) S-adenosylmethionine ribosyltransferase-isomerase QueA [Candidatus Uhrbacteria bacterium]
MGTSTDLFDYHLPPELIAQCSAQPRDHSRLMILDRRSGAWQHKRFYQVMDELHEGDVLVMNDTKVFRARLKAQVNGREVELFLLRPRGETWDVLVKPGKHMNVGDVIHLGEIQGRVLGKSDVLSVAFDLSAKDLIEFANMHGEIPVPPYVHEVPANLDQYQTVYAKETGSVAAPTAGFHFTPELLQKIREEGIEIHEVTLHVGLGTFRPMKTATIEEHEMHAEFVTITPETAQAINAAKQEDRRVVAVGTTTVRTLEGVAQSMLTLFRPCEKKSADLAAQGETDFRIDLPDRQAGEKKSSAILPPQGFSGDVDLFITPGFQFNIVDALITNFHLPKSTLLVLVSAFTGREHVLAAYVEAIRERYRFFSFGDAMFIQ